MFILNNRNDSRRCTRGPARSSARVSRPRRATRPKVSLLRNGLASPNAFDAGGDDRLGRPSVRHSGGVGRPLRVNLSQSRNPAQSPRGSPGLSRSADPAQIPPEGGTPTRTGGIPGWSPAFRRSAPRVKIFTAVVGRRAPNRESPAERSSWKAGGRSGLATQRGTAHPSDDEARTFKAVPSDEMDGRRFVGTFWNRAAGLPKLVAADVRRAPGDPL